MGRRVFLVVASSLLVCACAKPGSGIATGADEGCPADLAGAVGASCANEGKTCSPSSASMRLIMCSRGKWTELEAPPPPPHATQGDDASAAPSASPAPARFDPDPRPFAIVAACWPKDAPERATGSFVARLTIDAAGGTTAAKVTGLDASHASCVERFVAHWRYPRDGAGAVVLACRWDGGRASVERTE